MPKGVYGRPLKLCSVNGCNKKHYCKGLCKKCYDRQYSHKDNKESRAKYNKQYREKRKEYFAKYHKKYAQDNKKHRAEYQKQYHHDHKEHITAYMKRYSETPKGKAIIRANIHNYRTLTKDLTKKVIQQVYEDNIKKYGTLTCYLCNKPIAFGKDSLDHSTPLIRKGNNDYKNLGVAHLICNKRKFTKTLNEWFEKTNHKNKEIRK